MTIRPFLFALVAMAPSLSRAAETGHAAPGRSSAHGGDAAGSAVASKVSTYVYLRPEAAKGGACAGGAQVEGGVLRLPLFAPQTAPCVVARIGEDVISMADLMEALAMSHETRPVPVSHARGKSPDMDFAPALGRLVDMRLITEEAREMGLEALPENQRALDDFRASTLRILLSRQASKDVKPDPKEVDRAFKSAVREWKVKSVFFEKEEDAKKFQDELKKGKKFDEVVKSLVAAKKAKGGDVESVTAAKALPQIRLALEKLKVGAVSPMVKLTNGQVFLRVDAISYPANPKAKADAEQASLARRRQQAVRKFYESLVKKYAKVDEALLKQLDFEAKKPGFEALAKDQRPLVTIQGEKPFTVGDFANGFRNKFFHGMEGPIKEHKVNVAKVDVFESELGARLFAKEAAVRKLAESREYRRALDEYRRAVLFSSFIERVIIPGVKVSEDEAKRFYGEHPADFSYPAMYKLDSVGFATSKDAQTALEKLRSGTDLGWMRANGDGQLKPEARSIQFDGSVISATTLGADLNKALTGAKAGDYRLYATGSQYYVIRITDQTPPKLRPYEEVRETIAKKLQTDKVGGAIKDYAAKLRKARSVEVLITRIGS